MKTYIREQSEDELKKLIRKGSKEILSSLRAAHPKALTIKELIKQTGEAESTVYSSVSSLKKENYIKEIGKVKSGPGRHRENAINVPTMKYLLEDGNHSMSKEYHYKLSRGNVEYDAEFLKVSDRQQEKLNVTPFLDQLLLLARDMQSYIKNEEDKDFKKWVPFRGKEYLCPNCKTNHELRDYLRAMLLRLLDKFEADERYCSFLTENEYDPSKNIGMGSLNQAVSLKKLEPKGTTESEILRILSIEKDTNKGKYECLAVDKSKFYVRAEIDTTLVTDELIPDTMVECITDVIKVDTELNILYVNLSRKGNDKIKRIDELSTFPQIRELITNIAPIIRGPTIEGEILTVEGIITQYNFLNSNKDSSDEFTNSVLLRDSTGMIPLKMDSRYSKKFRPGDKILVVGAVVNELKSLTAGNYSSVTKTGSVIITERNSPYQNEVYNKHLEVNSKLSQNKIGVRLTDVILTSSETRAFLGIENEGEIDLHLWPREEEFIAIQNKRQFIARDVSPNRVVFPAIPPGIEETLVVRFKG